MSYSSMVVGSILVFAGGYYLVKYLCEREDR